MESNSIGTRLILVCGLPGSGKTTLSRVLEQRFRAVRFCPDEWMESLGVNLHREETRAKVEALQWKFAQALLAHGMVVIIEWGTWARAERDTLRLEARVLGAAVELRYLSAPAEDLHERLRRRSREDPPIEWDTVRRWFEVFQAPEPEEMALFDPPAS